MGGTTTNYVGSGCVRLSDRHFGLFRHACVALSLLCIGVAAASIALCDYNHYNNFPFVGRGFDGFIIFVQTLSVAFLVRSAWRKEDTDLYQLQVCLLNARTIIISHVRVRNMIST